MYWTRGEDKMSNKNEVMKKGTISVGVEIKLNIFNMQIWRCRHTKQWNDCKYFEVVQVKGGAVTGMWQMDYLIHPEVLYIIFCREVIENWGKWHKMRSRLTKMLSD